jgi:hypothetical protein
MTSVCSLFKVFGICGSEGRVLLDVAAVAPPLRALKKSLRCLYPQPHVWVSDEQSVLSALTSGKVPANCIFANGEYLLTAALQRGWQAVVESILADFAVVIKADNVSHKSSEFGACTQSLCALRSAIEWCLAKNVLPEPYTVVQMLGLCAVSPLYVQALLQLAAATPDPSGLKTVIIQQFQTPQLTLRPQEIPCIVEAETAETAETAAEAAAAGKSETWTESWT